MPELKPKKRWFASHAKSSAFVVSLAIHGAILLAALSFVAVTVIQREDTRFEYKQVSRPRQPLKRLQVPVKVNKKQPKPKLRKRVVAKNVDRKVPDIKMPEMTGIKGGMGSAGAGGGVESIGFTLPEIDFFGAKARGEKVVFVVHFGPATISDRSDDKGNALYTPFSRMTGLTIRNRLADLLEGLPEYTLFNVACYWAADTWAMDPQMQLASPANKQKVRDWMAPVNPLEGDYEHAFARPNHSPFNRVVIAARDNYPDLIDKGLPFYAPKWIYPYVVPKEMEQKYAPDAPGGFMHWGRGVAWAILNQKPDTIFVLTTNYIDGWHESEMQGGQRVTLKENDPRKMAQSLSAMMRDVYGVDRKKWPTINIVVLAKAGREAEGANRVLNDQFGPIWRISRGTGSVIADITKFMNAEERALMLRYKAQYGE